MTAPAWVILAAAAALSLSGVASGAARYLGHVPHDPYYPAGAAGSVGDADVKLPGRHFPRLPYFTSHDDPPPAPPNHDYPSSPGHYAYDYPDPPYRDYVAGGEQEETEGGLPQSDSSGSLPQPQQTSPNFDRSQPRSVRVQAGRTASLVCRVNHLGDKSVSWMRVQDLHILTVDKYKYSTDRRLSVEVDAERREWRLSIREATQEDAGRYECQVSTKPVLSFIVSLEVVDSLPSTTPFPNLRDAEVVPQKPEPEKKVPSATILNGPEIHVHRGSLINLTCVVEHNTERPLFLLWYHYGEVIDYISVGAEVRVRQSGRRIVSQLLVDNAATQHSGKYTCRPSNGDQASVLLHVLDGEQPAAMQTNAGSRVVTSAGTKTLWVLLLLLLTRC